MPNYQYQSLTRDGQVRNGVVAANDRGDAIRLLLSRGETATRVDPMQDGSSTKTNNNTTATASSNGQSSHGVAQHVAPTSEGAASFTKFDFASLISLPNLNIGHRKPTLSRSEMSTFIRELATAIEAGLPLMQSLRTVRKQASNRSMATILDHLIERVEGGDTLYKAARDYGKPFDDLLLGMLRAADASGEMSQVLHQLADLLDRSLELRREVLGATFYPMIVAGLIAASAVILVTVLVPQLITPLVEGATISLPWPTQVVLAIAEFIGAYWMYCVATLVVLWLGWRAWVRVPENRYRVDLLILKTPVVGRLLRDVAVARFTRTLGTLSSAGLPILESLRITQNTLVNRALMRALDEVQDQVTSGKPLAEPLERSGLFPPLLIQVVNLGERSGRLENMLMHAATAFDRQVNASLKLFTKALPPALLIIMAALGGFVLAAILLPLLELQNLVG